MQMERDEAVMMPDNHENGAIGTLEGFSADGSGRCAATEHQDDTSDTQPLVESVELLSSTSDISSTLTQECDTMEKLLIDNSVPIRAKASMSLFERYSLVIGESIRRMSDTSAPKTDVWKRQKQEMDMASPSTPATPRSSDTSTTSPKSLSPYTMIENYFISTQIIPRRIDVHQEWLEEETKKLLVEKINNRVRLTPQELRVLKKMRINIFKEKVFQEYRQFGYNAQFTRDARLWYKTLQSCPPDRQGILQRIFTVIRYGGLLMSPWNQEKSTHQKWKFWRKTGWPIATALSHGSRVIIQLDRERQPKSNRASIQNPDTDSASYFWNWLITGDPQCEAYTCISTAMTSQIAHKQGKVLFKRLGATHCIDYFQQKMQFKLPANRMKLIHEVKSLGLTDSKVLAGRRTSLLMHAHWGLNVPVGGQGEEPYVHTLTKEDIPLTPEEESERIDVSGKYGHMYIYYLAPTMERFGGLLIGVESSEPQVEDTHGEVHTIKAKSPLLSPTAGFKWYKKGDKPDLRDCFGPSKYNGMLIDLTDGWRFLMKKEWRDEFVFETCERPKPIKRDTQEFIRQNINVPMGFLDLL